MTLGAPRNQVVWMALRESLILLAAGLAFGIPAALLLGKFVATQWFEVIPADLGSRAAAVAFLSLVAVAAGFIPARRASEIDPAHALRYE